MRKLIALVFLPMASILYGQVGINTTSPDPSSVLDIVSANKGLLVPRIALTSVNDNTTVNSPATGLLVWNNGTAGLSTKGFYYWDTKWNPIAGSSTGSTGSGWALTGDNVGNYNGANTNLSIGTSTYDDFVVKANSKIVQRLGVDGKILIGENTSSNYRGLSIGYGATGTANEASAIGYSATANGYQSLAIGHNAKTNSNGETAVGINTVTNGQNSTAIGSGSNALAQNSTAIGYGATTSQSNAVILGNTTTANVGIATSTPNVNAKLDVNGTIKIGTKGSIQKNQFAFKVYPSVSFANVVAGKVVSIDITIPSASQPTNFANAIATVNAVNLGNDNFAIVSSRLSSASTLKVFLMNISETQQSIYSGEFNIFISEFF